VVRCPLAHSVNGQHHSSSCFVCNSQYHGLVLVQGGALAPTTGGTCLQGPLPASLGLSSPFWSGLRPGRKRFLCQLPLWFYILGLKSTWPSACPADRPAAMAARQPRTPQVSEGRGRGRRERNTGLLQNVAPHLIHSKCWLHFCCALAHQQQPYLN
jgi:hypothetical protein